MCKNCKSKKFNNDLYNSYKRKRKDRELPTIEELKELFIGFGSVPEEHSLAILGQPKEVAETIKQLMD